MAASQPQPIVSAPALPAPDTKCYQVAEALNQAELDILQQVRASTIPLRSANASTSMGATSRRSSPGRHVHPKQLNLDCNDGKLYWSDR